MSAPIIESPDAVLTTLDKEGKRVWMYPTPSPGRFWRWRMVVGWLLIAFFVALPWIQIQGKPAVFLNLARREFTFFGLTLHPTDSILLMFSLLFVLLSVYFFTALFGRVWCGWGCPQTVYLEFVYRPLERLIEGNENRRRRRDQEGWGVEKALRKSVKFIVFLVVSAFLAHTFVAYFASWDYLLGAMVRPPTEAPGYFFFMAFVTALVLFDFGFFREQMCTIACPYARFQSVLMDADSMIVSYDPNRGETRGTSRLRKQAEKKGPISLNGEKVHFEDFGDCIDCGACVRTCPTGIDIRNGLQMECIACTQCIDACDEIMEAIGKPKGLIRYTSEHSLEGKKTRILRPRLFLYMAILTALAILFMSALTSRSDLEIDISRVAGTTYSTTNTGEIANRLRFRLRNRTATDFPLEIRLVEPAEAQLRLVESEVPFLQAGALHRIEAWVTMAPEAIPPGGLEATFEFYADDTLVEKMTFHLLGPIAATNPSGVE